MRLHALAVFEQILAAALQQTDARLHGGAFLRREALVAPDARLVPAQGREHVARGLQNELALVAVSDDLLQIADVVRRDAAVELHGDVCLLQHLNRLGHDGVARGVIAQAEIGLVRGAVERDVDALRRVLGKPPDGLLVDERGVGVDRYDEAHFPKFPVQFPEARIGQRLAARKQEQQRALFLHHARQRQPFLHGAQALAGSAHLLGRHAHIAHFAAHGAHRRQLKRARERDAANVGTAMQMLHQCAGASFSYHFGSPSRVLRSSVTGRSSGVQASR